MNLTVFFEVNTNGESTLDGDPLEHRTTAEHSLKRFFEFSILLPVPSELPDRYAEWNIAVCDSQSCVIEWTIFNRNFR